MAEPIETPVVPPETPAATGTTPTTATPKPEDTVAYWREQYNGKNGTAVKLQRQLEASLLNEKNSAEKLSRIEVESEAKIQTYEEQVKAAQKERDEAKVEASRYTRMESVRTIANDAAFKRASSLLDEDDIKLLAGKTDDEVKAYLTRQEAKLSKFVTGTEEERNLGTLPQQPAGDARKPPNSDLKQLATNLEKATSKFGFGSKEYQEAYDAHFAGILASSVPQV